MEIRLKELELTIKQEECETQLLHVRSSWEQAEDWVRLFQKWG